MFLYILLVIIFLFRIREGMENSEEKPLADVNVRLEKLTTNMGKIDKRLKKLEKDINEFQNS